MSERITLESCICGEHFDCPDGWHSDDELPCSCTADCALENDDDQDGAYSEAQLAELDVLVERWKRNEISDREYIEAAEAIARANGSGLV
jgi:hypothetical protein